MIVMTGHKVGEPNGEQLLIELHQDDAGEITRATLATRPEPDQSIAWSEPIAYFTKASA